MIPEGEIQMAEGFTTHPVASALETRQPSEDIEFLFTQILESEAFRTAPMLQALLLYLWQQRNGPVSDYAIATEALGRRPDFDSKTDAAVRVHVGRLRAKLKEFYEKAPTFPLRISVPHGVHQMEAFLIPAAPATEAAHFLSEVPRRTRGLVIVLAVTVAMLALVCTILLAKNRGLQTAKAGSHATLPKFWRSFLGTNGAATMVMPTPVFFFWGDTGIIVRDTSVTSYSNLSTSKPLKELARRWGPPQLGSSYTRVMDVLEDVKLQRYLELHGRHTELIAANNLSVEAFSQKNTVFIGIPQGSDRIAQLLEKTNFRMSVGDNAVVVRNTNPGPGERREYVQSVQSVSRKTWPGIIALLPINSGVAHSLVLAGNSPSSLLWLLTSDNGLKLVDENWRKGGAPDYFEMVVETEMDGDTVLKVLPVGFRRVAADYDK
jgi:hypothetical protein